MQSIIILVSTLPYSKEKEKKEELTAKCLQFRCYLKSFSQHLEKGKITQKIERLEMAQVVETVPGMCKDFELLTTTAWHLNSKSSPPLKLILMSKLLTYLSKYT